MFLFLASKIEAGSTARPAPRLRLGAKTCLGAMACCVLAWANVGFSASPADGSLLYAKHVLFLFEPIADAATYQLQVVLDDGSDDPFVNPLVVDTASNTRRIVVKSGLEFGNGAPNQYAWRARGIDGGGQPGDWSPTSRFSIAPLEPNLPPMNLLVSDPARMQPGITIFDVLRQGVGTHAIAVDEQGQVVWFQFWKTSGQDLRQLPNGNMLMILDDRATEFTLTGQIVWQTLPGFIVNHEAFPMPDGSVLCVVEARRFINRSGQQQLWRGDSLIRFDRNGREMWSWSPFDHISTSDFDAEVMSAPTKSGDYDWARTNACFYDPVGNAVYVSLRNLSRICKIDYATGQVLWSMGAKLASGNAPFGDGLFKFQNTIQLLSNGNLLTYNNGDRREPPPPGVRASEAIEIQLNNLASPSAAQLVWHYTTPVYTSSLGDADRLPNGNTLVCAGKLGHIIEVDAAAQPVWHLLIANADPLYKAYRADRISSLYGEDDDGDGVLNALDQCSDTSSEELVSEKGCPCRGVDEDGDGFDDCEKALPIAGAPLPAACGLGCPGTAAAPLLLFVGIYTRRRIRAKRPR